MNVSELLTNLNQQGVQLWADQDKLRISSPKGVLTPQLRVDLAIYKTEILTFLQEHQEPADETDTGLSLQAIGRLIGGFCDRLSAQFKSPVIDPGVMAKHLQVTFRPLPNGFKNATILAFRAELEQTLRCQGVQILPWQAATREFRYDFTLPFIPWKTSIPLRVVKADVHAVIDVERPKSAIGILKSFIAEKIYHLYSQTTGKSQNRSVAKIAQFIGWAEDHAIQRLEDPTATQVISITELDPIFADLQLPYSQKIAIGVKTLVNAFSEIVIGVSPTQISVLNMNLSDSLFSREQFNRFVVHSLIPKIYVPIAPLPLSRFEVSTYNPHQSDYAANLVRLSQELATTDLFPAGFKLKDQIRRQSHRDIVDSIVNGRTGVSYGFVCYAEAPQYVGDREILEQEWEQLLTVDGFSRHDVRKNASGRRYIKTKIKDQYLYKQIPDIWLVCSRSGANKTDLNLERDILRIGLKDRLCLQVPEGIDLATVDIKPSYDTYVMVALALAAALYAPQLIVQGAPMIHFHGYPCSEWFHASEGYGGVENPSVPCGTYESGVFNFLSLHRLADQVDNPVLVSLIEPDHGTNMITSNLEYLLTRLRSGIQHDQIQLGSKHFASLIEHQAIAYQAHIPPCCSALTPQQGSAS
jgi:TubC N-terminal docking domain